MEKNENILVFGILWHVRKVWWVMKYILTL